MASILQLKEIQEIIKNVDVIDAMEQGFIAYSNGHSVVPPVGELLFEEPKGETHIKYGYIKNQEYYCIKIASGFFDNPKLGIPSNQGLMLIFSQKTGKIEAILLDDGYLTDLRTAAAGALSSKYFAPEKIKAVGIIGTGVQAQLQLDYSRKVRKFDNVMVWGRNKDHALAFQKQNNSSFNIKVVEQPIEICENCNLIITCTPSDQPILKADHIQPGTHITAMGSDTNFKQELDTEILNMANIVIADSIPQSQSRGEIYQAVSKGKISENKVIELGKAIQNKGLCRTNDNQISVVDLTGVAVQDIMIATAVFDIYKSSL